MIVEKNKNQVLKNQTNIPLIPVFAEASPDVHSKTRTNVKFAAASESALEDLIKPVVVQPPLVDKKYVHYPEPWSRWGLSNNQFPYYLIKYVQKCGLLARSIQTLASFTAANGVFFYTLSNGMIQEADDKYLQLWIKAKGPRWLYRSAMDYWTFGAPFTKFIYDSSPKRKPLFIAHENASYCRWEKQTPKTRTVDIGYISNQWDTMFSSPDISPDEYVQMVQALDPFYADLQLENMNEPIYMIGMDNYTPDAFYYPSQPWHSTDILNMMK